MVPFKLFPVCQSLFSPLFENHYEEERQNEELRLIHTTGRTPQLPSNLVWSLHAFIHINRSQYTADKWHRPVTAYQEKYQSLCYPWMRNVTVTDFTHTACPDTLDSPPCQRVNFAGLLFTTKASIRQAGQQALNARQQLHPTHLRVPASFSWE